MLNKNKSYELVFESKKLGKKFYAPVQSSDYHMSRYVAAGAQNIYSSAGTTKETLTAILNEMLNICNNEKKNDRLRTDIGTLCNNLLYRTKYPVDEDCALRMGAIYVMLEDEDPDTVLPHITNQKIEMAHEDPELYTFFLSIGIESTPVWKDLEKDMINTDYFEKRRETIRSLLPPKV